MGHVGEPVGLYCSDWSLDVVALMGTGAIMAALPGSLAEKWLLS